jgi:protein tyrosine phosphatase type 4A
VETTFPKKNDRETDRLTIPPTLAVHCQAGTINTLCCLKNVMELFSFFSCEGLGRAPVLVAIALIENGMDNLSAINYVRERRRDAFNKQQLNFLVHYKPIRKGCQCVVM